MKYVLKTSGFIGLCLIFMLLSCGKKAAKEHLLCYVGGTMRPAMEALQKEYEAKTGNKVDFDQGESGQLTIRITETKKGDLFVCHDPFQMDLNKKGLEEKFWVMASLSPVIVVVKGNPKKITGLKSLGEKGLKLILTHPLYSTMGHIVPEMGKKAGVWDAIKANVISETRSGGEAANAVSIGTADAAIVWNAVAYLRTDKLDTVSIESDYRLKSGVDVITAATFGKIDMGDIRVTISTLKCSKNLKEATAFAEFAVSPEAREIWKKFGFGVPTN